MVFIFDSKKKYSVHYQLFLKKFNGSYLDLLIDRFFDDVPFDKLFDYVLNISLLIKTYDFTLEVIDKNEFFIETNDRFEVFRFNFF